MDEATDPFEHFDQEERSWSLIEELRPRLLEEAKLVLERYPGAEVAALIAEAGTAEHAALRAATEVVEEEAPELENRNFYGVVPRRLALGVVQAESLVAWAAENSPEGCGRLLVVCATKNGFRMASLPL